MITGKLSFQIWAQGNNTFQWCKKISVKKGWLKSRSLSEEKKPTRAQIFLYFGIESRNKNIQTILAIFFWFMNNYFKKKNISYEKL